MPVLSVPQVACQSGFIAKSALWQPKTGSKNEHEKLESVLNRRTAFRKQENTCSRGA